MKNNRRKVVDKRSNLRNRRKLGLQGEEGESLHERALNEERKTMRQKKSKSGRRPEGNMRKKTSRQEQKAGLKNEKRPGRPKKDTAPAGSGKHPDSNRPKGQKGPGKQAQLQKGKKESLLGLILSIACLLVQKAWKWEKLSERETKDLARKMGRLLALLSRWGRLLSQRGPGKVGAGNSKLRPQRPIRRPISCPKPPPKPKRRIYAVLAATAIQVFIMITSPGQGNHPANLPRSSPPVSVLTSA
jgi:hypothetical protein